MKNYLIHFSVLLLLVSCSNNQQSSEHLNTASSKPKLEVKTYLSNDKIKGWGYDIYQDGVLFVHQPNIPAVSGDKGFKSEEEAKRVGSFIIHKIEQNIIPPTLTTEEMDSLKIEYK